LVLCVLNFTIPLLCIVIFLSFYLILDVFFSLLELSINFKLHFLNTSCYEDAFALASCFWLDDVHNWRVSVALLLGHDATLDFLVSFSVLSIVIFLQLMHISGVDPGLWEEVVVVREFFFKALQVNCESVFSG
jgi:hypothetical protein